MQFRTINLKRLTALVLLSQAGAVFAGPQYSVVDLGTMGGDYSMGLSVNDSGQVAGYSHTADNLTMLGVLGQSGSALRALTGLGGSVTQAEEESLTGHGTSLMAGNEATGQWIKRSPFDAPQVLAHLLGTRLQVARGPNHGEGLVEYRLAPKLAKLSKGEDMFRSRCTSCHTMGTQDGIGPGLALVTQQRDRKWLARWLKAPDKMIEEKDPIATALYAKYNQISMPNLKLRNSEVESLIQFMESQTRLAQQSP